MTHYAVLSGKYRRAIVNDFNPMSTLFLQRAINGEYLNKRAFITRNIFYKCKIYDPYVRYVWSYSNNGNNYMYGNDEVMQKALHYVCFFNDFSLLKNIDTCLSLRLKEVLNDVVNWQNREKNN